LETRLGSRLNSCHPFISYLVEHAAKTINRYRVGQDGKTAYRRWKGKDFKVEIPEIGEKVFYLPRKIDIIDKSVPRWSYGIFVGVTDDSNEMQIAVKGDIKLVRDIRRIVKLSDRWDRRYFDENVTKNCWEHGGPEEHFVEDELMTAIPEIDDPVTPVAGFAPEHQVKRMYLKASDATKRGLWPLRCPGCRSIRDNSKRQGHTEECRASIEKILNEQGDPRFQASYARIAVQVMEKDKGEKREPDEDEERQPKKPRIGEEESSATSSGSRAMPQATPQSTQDMMTSDEPNEKSPELDGDGDVLMDVQLDNHFEVINLDKVNYFSDRQTKKTQQDIVSKKFGATLYDENVVDQVIANAKASSDSKRTAMMRARKTAQIAEIAQFKASLEFVSVHAKDTIMSYPIQCDCYECDVNVTVRSKNREDTKISRMRSSMRISSDELKDEDIDVTREGVKARYAITRRMLLSKLKKRLIERGRIDQISGFPVMATECYWDDLSGKELKTSLVKKARKE